MMPFRLLLVLILTAITLYTGVVVAHHGLDLLPVFFGDMAGMAWPAGHLGVAFRSVTYLTSDCNPTFRTTTSRANPSQANSSHSTPGRRVLLD